MKNQKTMGNKGFSLVELIVVIAIMVVLVAVLAPVFTKYVEQSRRATDVQNANSIAEAVMTDAADGTIDGDKSAVEVKDDNRPSAIQSNVQTAGNAIKKGNTFSYDYDASNNTVTVYVTGDKTNPVCNLATEAGATAYKSDAKADDEKVGD